MKDTRQFQRHLSFKWMFNKEMSDLSNDDFWVDNQEIGFSLAPKDEVI